MTKDRGEDVREQISAFDARYFPSGRIFAVYLELRLHDVAIERVALLHADVDQLQGVLEAVQGLGELLLGRSARSFIGDGPRLAHGLDRVTGPVDPLLDFGELLGGLVGSADGRLDPAERGD